MGKRRGLSLFAEDTGISPPSRGERIVKSPLISEGHDNVEYEYTVSSLRRNHLVMVSSVDNIYISEYRAIKMSHIYFGLLPAAQNQHISLQTKHGKLVPPSPRPIPVSQRRCTPQI